MEQEGSFINAIHDAKRLEELRALPLERKIQISQARIIEWYRHFNGQVVVSFSGGKDSTVLLHMVRSIFPDVKAVFSNTGLEYPEIQQHVMSYPNIDIIRPPMRFDQVISTYGYPLIGKEVAEAIYYARRIRSQSLNVEREREQSEWMRENRYTNGSEPNLSGTASPENNASGEKITERLQNWGGYSKRENPESEQAMAGQKNTLIQTSTARNRRTALQGKIKPLDADAEEPG